MMLTGTTVLIDREATRFRFSFDLAYIHHYTDLFRRNFFVRLISEVSNSQITVVIEKFVYSDPTGTQRLCLRVKLEAVYHDVLVKDVSTE